jgi:hypothetical protein
MALALLQSTGDAVADGALLDVIGAFEEAFPRQIRGYYVLGSLSDSSAVRTSDLDLTIMARSSLRDKERKVAAHLARQCVAASAMELDIEVADEETTLHGARPNFKFGSILVYGEDIREQAPLIALHNWTRDRMHSSYWRIAHLFNRPEIIELPLDYPNPEDEFYGYTTRMIRLSDGRELPGTRDLIRLTGWAATALLALERGIYVARKSDCHVLYRQHIDDAWSTLLEDTYALCRMRWNYLIPIESTERLTLRDLCMRTLSFEQHFLQVYTTYLLTELSGDTAAARFAVWVMERTPYRHPAVAAALEAVAYHEDDDIRGGARNALGKLFAEQGVR